MAPGSGKDGRSTDGLLPLADIDLVQVLDALPVAVIVVDRSGTIRVVNHHATELFAYAREELIGASVEALVPEEQRELHPSERAAYWETPVPRRMGEGRDLLARRKDGSNIAVEIGLAPLSTPGLEGVIATVSDIRERNRASSELAERTRELERSNRELEQFAYVASHDLQEPLRMVTSYAELLQKRYGGTLDERADRYIHHAVEGARHMQQMLRDLLALSRVSSCELVLEPVDLEEVVDEAWSVLAHEDATLDCAALPRVLGDRSQLVRVFTNLLSNALKYRRDTPLHVKVDASREDSRWVVRVADNGMGFEQSHAERIFEMFQRLHERGTYPGNGIGLAVVAKIVERHGGRISAEGQPDVGATFRLTLRGIDD